MTVPAARGSIPVVRGSRASYLMVLSSAVCCYAALGAVIRTLPSYVDGRLHQAAFAVGVAVGIPAIASVITRPGGGRLADAVGPRTVLSAGAVVMALGALPMFSQHLAPLLVSRVLVGVGEGAMMSASVLWLLRLAGPQRRGRALAHSGLANYAGLTIGPLLAQAAGAEAHPQRVFVEAAVLPLLCLPAAALARPGNRPPSEAAAHGFSGIFTAVMRPGCGLLLMNVGYVALLSFGARAMGSGGAALLPVYGVTVILVRVFGGGVPDRLGARRTIGWAAPTSAAGLLIIGLASGPLGLVGAVVTGIGQALAVPALGLIAIESVPAAQHGVASGTFFAWFDTGVAVGGPMVGAVASLGGAVAAMAAGAGAVGLTGPVAIGRARGSGAPSPPTGAG